MFGKREVRKVKEDIMVAKKNKALVAFLLDETGSMQICRDSTISGFNEYVESLKNDEDVKYRFTLVKFNSMHTTTVHDKVKAVNIIPLTVETYIPNYATPLYDAVAHVVKLCEGEKRKKIIVIMTDGQENASVEYGQKAIFDLISAKRDEGWEFVFLGANQDAWVQAGRIGIPQASAATYQQGAEVKTMRTAYFATAGVAKGLTRDGDTLSRWTDSDGKLKTDES